MNTTIFLIIFVIVGSMIFPLVGYYLDWKHNKKMHMKGQKGKKETAAEQS